jgi:hypothetical protein
VSFEKADTQSVRLEERGIAMSRASKMLSSLAALAMALSAPEAAAVPPHLPQLVTGGNLWTITFFDDTSPIHTQWATQHICFYQGPQQGTHQLYQWVSISYPDWNGRATQEGDQIFMHGDFQWPFGITKDGGHDGMQWELVTFSPTGEANATPRGEIGTGHWQEWVEDGKLGWTIGWGNALFRRVGSCRFLTYSDALSYAEQLKIAIPLDQGGDNPMGIPADVYKMNADAAGAQ